MRQIKVSWGVAQKKINNLQKFLHSTLKVIKRKREIQRTRVNKINILFIKCCLKCRLVYLYFFWMNVFKISLKIIMAHICPLSTWITSTLYANLRKFFLLVVYRYNFLYFLSLTLPVPVVLEGKRKGIFGKKLYPLWNFMRTKKTHYGPEKNCFTKVQGNISIFLKFHKNTFLFKKQNQGFLKYIWFWWFNF